MSKPTNHYGRPPLWVRVKYHALHAMARACVRVCHAFFKLHLWFYHASWFFRDAASASVDGAGWAFSHAGNVWRNK